jgi:pheromone shutdown protein TraB
MQATTHCAMAALAPAARRPAAAAARRRRRAPPRAAAAAPPPAPVSLPPALAQVTAVLTGADGAEVFVLGVSHCSQASVRDVRELIALVRPDTVLVELCAARADLLLDPAAPAPTRWAAPRVRVRGMPTGGAWPSGEEVAAAAGLRSGGGAAVGEAAMEADAAALLATGLFGSARPGGAQPGAGAMPAFAVGAGGRLETIAPLAAVEFAVTERRLPAPEAFAVEVAAGAEAPAAAAAEAATAAALAAAGSPLGRLLEARRLLLAALPADHDVALGGAEGGRVAAAVRRLAPGERRALSGLEAPAAGGQGVGIEPAQRRAQGAAPAPEGAAGAAAAAAGLETEIAPWPESSAAGAAPAPPSGLSAPEEVFAASLTGAYAKLQAAAGRAAGVAPGAAWRAALEAADAAGAAQVLLGDRPAGVTKARLGKAVARRFLVGALPVASVVAVVGADGLNGAGAPLAAVVAAAALPLGAAAWTVAAPLLEIFRFSRLSAAEIEAAARPAEALGAPGGQVALWGEDALLKWPGALAPVIAERDAFMARALAAAARGLPEGGVPAYVRAAGAWQCAMPAGAPAGACPPGAGAGAAAAPRRARRAVAVVGSAHVRGIAAAWPAAVAPGGDVSLEKFM